MNVLVCGSPSFFDRGRVFDVLDRIAQNIGVSRIVYGDAEGADLFACEWADRRNIRTENFAAKSAGNDKKRFGFLKKRKRGADGLDLVVAFPGTDRTDEIVRTAKKGGLTVIEVDRQPAPATATAGHTYATAS